MNTEQRVIFETTDISKEVNDFRTGVANFAYTTGQYLYVASVFPFNNLWFEMDTVNAVTASVSAQIWWSNQWADVVDITDETDGLKNSGRIQWSVDIDKAWQQQYKAEDVPQLSTLKIYNMYWMRFAWSANLTAGTKIGYIGQKFANDTILQSFYPDLLNTLILDSFKTGKTDWNEQHFMAAEHIIRDLKKRNIIRGRSQLLDHSLFQDASCHKLAEIVYTAFGQGYAPQKDTALKAYDKALNISYYNVDQNSDGKLDPCERSISVQFGTR